MQPGLRFLSAFALPASADLDVTYNLVTGAISRIRVAGDATQMQWLTPTDGSAYPWITARYGWGLGYTTLVRKHKSQKVEWNMAKCVHVEERTVDYRMGDLCLRVTRTPENGALVERYVFTNAGREELTMSETGIYTPFNDHYSDAATCINGRANAHIWHGGSAAYVCALRMGAYAPHLGLVVTEGEIEHYEVWERNEGQASSNDRGLFALNIPEVTLRPGESYTLAWRLFDHHGKEDFRAKLLQAGSVLVDCDKYVYERGETARVTLTAGHRLEQCALHLNGVPVQLEAQTDGKRFVARVPLLQEGEARFDFHYDGQRHTHALCLVTEGIKRRLATRADFIVDHQQMNDPRDPRDGAYMVYDNEGDSIFPNDRPSVSYSDRDEGAERMGMGLFLAKQYLKTKDKKLRESLLRYVKFTREKLQTPDYVTYSTVDHRYRNRGYNYPWAANLYFLAYRITGDKQHALDGYHTMQALFRQFGYGFYCIEYPVVTGLETLKKAGLKEEYDRLLQDYRRLGEVFLKNGLNYPQHEVNYEQSIVAPAIYVLEQLYMVTGEQKYLDEVRRQLPVMEAFNGFQPSYHLHDIAIRHWDGYWFGKREMYGDTLPHYWSAITATVYHYYAMITGDKEYERRAQTVVDGNLCLFTKDGRGSCAYVYPRRVNGCKADFADPYANDQDFALYYHLLVNDGHRPKFKW